MGGASLRRTYRTRVQQQPPPSAGNSSNSSSSSKRLCSSFSLFAGAAVFVPAATAEVRVAIFLLMRLSMVCPTPPPWGIDGGKAGELSLKSCLMGRRGWGVCRRIFRKLLKVKRLISKRVFNSEIATVWHSGRVFSCS